MALKRTCILLTMILLMAGCNTRKGKQESREAPVTVTVSSAQKISSAREIKLSGNIEGLKTVRLGFLVAGRINYVACNEGDPVTSGRILASLDPASYEIAKELADIQVNQVQDEFNRLSEMHDKQSISESDFAKISFGLQQAKAQQKLHAKNLADTRLYSPIDGILLKRLAEPGEITGIGLPVFVVSDIRKVKVNAPVPESELLFFRIGTKAKVNIPALGRDYEGKIIEVGSAADPATRTFTARIEVDNPGQLIRPGMIAEIAYQTDSKENMLAIPIEAFLHDNNGQGYIFVADTLKHIAFRRDIATGRFRNSMIEVVSGLSEGEKVVTGGQQKLTDGSPIDIR
jgi:RND family efflux transporter MFP subunit